jgi:hypothetical protein
VKEVLTRDIHMSGPLNRYRLYPDNSLGCAWILKLPVSTCLARKQKVVIPPNTESVNAPRDERWAILI